MLCCSLHIEMIVLRRSDLKIASSGALSSSCHVIVVYYISRGEVSVCARDKVMFIGYLPDGPLHTKNWFLIECEVKCQLSFM